MRNSIIRFTLALITAIALTGCGDEINPTGTISGYAFLCDTLGRQLPNSAGITVTIDNTTRSAQTDSLGHYVFSAVPKGIYSISFSKNGFASNKYVNLQFIGKDEYVVGQDEAISWSEQIRQLPTINSISNASVNFNSTTEAIVFSGTLHSSLAPTVDGLYTSVDCKIFISKSNQVSSLPNQYEQLWTTWSFICYNGSTPFGYYIPKESLSNLGYQPGQTLYAILYPDYGLSTSYKDIKTNKPVYTSLGTPSPVLSFTVPE